MYIVSVVPLTSSLPTEALSYYHQEKIAKNALVEIKIRNKTTFGLAVKCTDVKNAKSEIKNSDFKIKHLDRVVTENFFTEAFLEAAKKTAHEYNLYLGQTLEVLTTKDLLASAHDAKKATDPKKKTVKKSSSDVSSEIIEARFSVRKDAYLEKIKKTFEANQSAFLIIPDQQSGAVAKAFYEEHFPEQVFFFHSSDTKKRFREKKETLDEKNTPVLVISTPSYLSLPVTPVGLVILEDENKESYRRQRRPFIDTRDIAGYFAESHKASFVRGASVIRTESYKHLKENTETKSPASKSTLTLPENTKVMDMTSYRKDQEGFAVFHKNTLKTLKESIDRGEKIFLFALRKGLASMTTCRDCGTTLMCPNCSAPLTLSNTPEGRVFSCGKCGIRLDAHDKILCAHCGGFQLEAFGLGIETLYEEITKLFPDVLLEQIDKTTTNTHPKAKKAAQRFHDIPDGTPAILLGTEMAIKYIEKPLDTCVVASIDTLFNIPNFRVSSKTFGILAEIAERTENTLFIQTRNPKSELLETFLAADLKKFHDKDLAERKRFDFPPYTRFVKVIGSVKYGQQKKQEDKLQHFFGKYDPLIYPSFVERVKKKYVINTLIKLRGDEELPDDLRKRLQALPTDYEVYLNPESIL